MRVDADLPAHFFEKTSADAKREYQRLQKQKQQEGMLMTRAMRAAAATPTVRKVHAYASVRVRLPEGIILQGMLYCRRQLLRQTACCKIRSRRHAAERTRIHSAAFWYWLRCVGPGTLCSGSGHLTFKLGSVQHRL